MSTEEARGRRLAEVFPLQSSEQGAPLLISPNGSRYEIEQTVSPIRVNDEDAGSVVVFRDVTQRRRSESELKNADRRKDEFLAMLAHELRNPLAALSAAATLLGMDKLDAQGVKRTSAVLSRQIKHMTGLIDDLLDVSRVTRGLVSLQQTVLDLNLVVADAVEQVRPTIEKRNHRLTLELAPGTPVVRGDHKRLVQVLANVLANSAKYTDSGGHIRLILEIGQKEVTVTVSDNGIGMSDELLGRAFQMFAQAAPSSDRAQGGLGIGLALVKSLVGMHGGRVTAHSPGPGLGSTVKVVLPRLTDESVVAAVAAPGPPASQASERILVVDDNEDAAILIGDYLSAMGYEVLIEHEAHQGLLRARSGAVSACLLDIGLPDFDGFELARRLRAEPNTATALLVAITGFGQPQDAAKARAAGFDHHFVKPVDMDKLLEVLRHSRSATVTDSVR